jgi:hypothetical protein
VGKNWKGVGFLYLLLLLALCWIPGMIKFNSSIFNFVINEAPKIVGQIPAITIFQGEVTTDKPGHNFIIDPDNGTLFGIIDTTGQFTSFEGTEAKFLLTKNKFMAKKSEYVF